MCEVGMIAPSPSGALAPPHPKRPRIAVWARGGHNRRQDIASHQTRKVGLVYSLSSVTPTPLRPSRIERNRFLTLRENSVLTGVAKAHFPTETMRTDASPSSGGVYRGVYPGGQAVAPTANTSDRDAASIPTALAGGDFLCEDGPAVCRYHFLTRATMTP